MGQQFGGRLPPRIGEVADFKRGGTPLVWVVHPPDWRGRRFLKGGTPPDRGVHPWFGEVVTFSMAMKVARKFWSRSAARADTFVKLQHFSVRRKVL